MTPKEIMTEIFFETFHVEALYAAKKAVLTAFAGKLQCLSL
jgi:actin-related protein